MVKSPAKSTIQPLVSHPSRSPPSAMPKLVPSLIVPVSVAPTVPNLRAVPSSVPIVTTARNARTTVTLSKRSTRVRVAKLPMHNLEETRAANDTVTTIADLQHHDGSYSLDERLLSLLQSQRGSFTLEGLETIAHTSIEKHQNAKLIWGTVLAAAFMMVALPNNRSLWDSLWDKARDFVCDETRMSPYDFNDLVQVGSELLK